MDGWEEGGRDGCGGGGVRTMCRAYTQLCHRAVGRLLKRGGGGRFKCQFLKGFFLH